MREWLPIQRLDGLSGNERDGLEEYLLRNDLPVEQTNFWILLCALSNSNEIEKAKRLIKQWLKQRHATLQS